MGGNVRFVTKLAGQDYFFVAGCVMELQCLSIVVSTDDLRTLPQMSCYRGNLGRWRVAAQNLSSLFPSGAPIRVLQKVLGRLQIINLHVSWLPLVYVPSPCFSHVVLDVEKGAYLGTEAIFQGCCRYGERRRVDRVRREHCAEMLGNDRGRVRMRFRRDNIMWKG